MFKFNVPCPAGAPVENWNRLVTLVSVKLVLNFVFTPFKIADSHVPNVWVPDFGGAIF